MAKTNAIGHTDCHVCGYQAAEVKLDKNGKAYLFCPDCSIQSFTRHEHQSDKLMAKMRPVTVTEKTQDLPPPPLEKTPVVKLTEPPKKAGFSLGDL